MRILVLQFIPETRQRSVPRFEPQLGTLLALLERRGHELALLGLARYAEGEIKAALARTLPQLIYADIAPVCVDAARRTFEYLTRHEPLPIVAGGLYPTVDPAGCLSLPGVYAVALGEPDASLSTYLERMKDPTAGQIVSGVWLRDERGLAQPGMPPLVEDLNSLPFAHRELFRYAEYVQRTGQIEIAVARGCPQRCAYCCNDRVRALYAGGQTWVRYRAPGNILAEIALLRERYPGVRLVRFLDHAFALDLVWLADFLPAYAQKCGLPFRCHVRANAADQRTIQRLAEAGCRAADIEVGSAGNLIRNEVFDMDLSAAQLRATFALLKHAGIRSRAIVYVGAPYESEASLEETRSLLARIQPDDADVRLYYPWPGTRARDLAQEHGWLHSRGEEQYHQDRSGLDVPACRAVHVARFIRRLRGELRAEVGKAWWWWRWPAVTRAALGQVFARRRV
jgi:radical SAM superfamily enzyme YgiQ (UPF0313 family)